MVAAAPRRRERVRDRFPGDRVVRVERARWGFATPTRILTLASGRRVVIQLVSDALAWHAPEGARVLRDAGLPVPNLVARLPRAGAVCLVWEFVRGAIGASLMDGPRAATLARQMGLVHRTIQAIHDPAIPSDEAWRSPAALHGAARGWLAAVGGASMSSVDAIVDRVVDRGWTPAPSHGDYVPANVLIDDRRITAVLDLGDVALRHPLVDTGWWSLIVAYHHGSDHARLEAAFLEGAGFVTTPDLRHELGDVAAVRALQLAASRLAPTAHDLRLLAVAMRQAGGAGAA